jgi:hypothetical protein
LIIIAEKLGRRIPVPTKKQAPKPTFAQKAKAMFTDVANALDPVKQLGPAAQKKMKQVRNSTGGPARERRINKEIDRQTGSGGMASRSAKKKNPYLYS